jgi:hypothetical protein
MLSSDGWTRWNRVQRRRRTHMQLKLFDRRQESPSKPSPWKHLGQGERAAVIATLTRLMVKAVRPDERRGKVER